MNDMRAVIVPKSDQINADDLLSGPLTITITNVQTRPGTEQPVSIFFAGDNGKPWKPCKSMCRVLVLLWGPDANAYAGRSVTLYNDPKVMWGGMAVGGIRISHLSHIESAQTLALTATKGSKKPYTVKPLAVTEAVPDANSKAEKWLSSLSRGLEKCDEVDAVHSIRRRADVKANLENAPPEYQARINALFKSAMDRLDPPADDDDSGFPGDTPADPDLARTMAGYNTNTVMAG